MDIALIEFEFNEGEDHEFKRHKHCCEDQHCCQPSTEHVRINIGPVFDCFDGTGFSIDNRRVHRHMELKDTQSVVLTASATDAAGKATTPTFSFAVSDPTILSLVDNGDGTALVSALDTGTTDVTATATDADGGTASGSISITVVAGPTTTVTVTAGTPTDNTPAPAPEPAPEV